MLISPTVRQGQRYEIRAEGTGEVLTKDVNSEQASTYIEQHGLRPVSAKPVDTVVVIFVAQDETVKGGAV